ncbi:MAG: hypothetical protein AAF808_15370, partial [Cyanobacteria bacterium P01_D01_bin.2]
MTLSCGTATFVSKAMCQNDCAQLAGFHPGRSDTQTRSPNMFSLPKLTPIHEFETYAQWRHRF